MKEQEESYIAKRNMRMSVLPEFKDLFETSSLISSEYTLTSNIQNFMASFLELWKCLEKTISKKRGVAGQEEFGQMELESMAKGGKVLAFEIRLAEYKDEALKNDENLQ